jgi:hypothetical protein
MGAAEGVTDAGKSSALFVYRENNLVANIIAAGYIDDAVDKGLQVNDVVIVVDDGTPTIDFCLVTVVDTTTNPNGDATLIQLA